MKKLIPLILAVAFIFAFNDTAKAQGGTQFGINIAPSWKVNSSRHVLTGLRTNQSGYGFNIGIPVKRWISEFMSFNTGLDYEFTAFDGFQNGQLVSSFRFNSLHMPLMFNINMSGNLYAMAGSGIVYNMAVKDLNNISFGTNVTSVTNNIQPYLGLGINSLIEKDWGYFEVGVLGRYQLLDIWKNDYLPMEPFNSHILSLDFIFRYYL